jgi:hypothetical protein
VITAKLDRMFRAAVNALDVLGQLAKGVALDIPFARSAQAKW